MSPLGDDIPRDGAELAQGVQSAIDTAKAARPYKPLSEFEKEAIDALTPEPAPMSCLGRDISGRMVLWSREGRFSLYRDPERITWRTLCHCSGSEDAAKRWLSPLVKAQDPSRRELLDAACDLLDKECHQRGEFDPSTKRGRGVWTEPKGEGWVYNSGAECFHIAPSRTITPTDAVAQKVLYLARTAAALPADEPMSDADAAAVLQSLRARPWAESGSGDMIAGWIVAAIVSGTLHSIHPHVWITAPAGTGKTTLCADMQRLTPYTLHACGANTTEAYIRQEMDDDAVPLMIDEAEATDDGDRNRDNVSRWLELLRTASYGGSQGKGSGAGLSKKYYLRFCACFFSIADVLSRDADLSRVLRLRLTQLSPVDMRAIWAGQQAGASILAAEDCPARFLRRVLLALPALRRNGEALFDALRKKYPQATDRRCDMLSVLLAGAHVYTSTGDMTAEQLAAAVRLAAPYVDTADTAGTDDVTSCLNVLLSRSVILRGTPTTVYGLCYTIATATQETMEQATAAESALATLGMKWSVTAEGVNEGLIVNTSRVNMKEIFRGNNQWAAGTAGQYLSRLPNINTARRRINGTSCYCLIIPPELILKEE